MKSALAIFSVILLLSVIGLCVFGFLGMDHKNSGHTACAAQKAGVDCISQLKTFSLAVFQSNGASAFLFAAFTLLAVLFFGIHKNAPAFQHSFLARSSEFFKFLFSSIQQELARWLALHQNSPASF